VDLFGTVAYPPSHADGEGRTMSRERAKTFVDRLPPVPTAPEDDLSSLPDEMVDILYPGRRPRPFRIGLTFEAFEGMHYSRAVELARRSSVYRETRDGEGLVHYAAFDSGSARTLRDLFDLVGGRPGTEVDVDGKRAPYGHELWLPLFWIFVGAEAPAPS
ncbi:MAG TPA: hypothetical protein VIC87_00740, partial [Vicinamibacteria bacterium]